ncbi:MAG: DUF4956 domain-containing protein [Bdellovibrionota bacterium]
MIDFLGRSVAGIDPEMLFLNAAVSAFLASILGVVVAYFYKFTSRNSNYSSTMFQVLVIMCVLIAIIMNIIGSNIARAFSLVGALSIIRFRTAMKDPKDTMYIFYAMAVGMACGVGLRGVAVLISFSVGLLIYLLEKLEVGGIDSSEFFVKVYLPIDSKKLITSKNTFPLYRLH